MPRLIPPLPQMAGCRNEAIYFAMHAWALPCMDYVAKDVWVLGSIHDRKASGNWVDGRIKRKSYQYLVSTSIPACFAFFKKPQSARKNGRATRNARLSLLSKSAFYSAGTFSAYRGRGKVFPDVVFSRARNVRPRRWLDLPSSAKAACLSYGEGRTLFSAVDVMPLQRGGRNKLLPGARSGKICR